jgi:hypothetical protein
MELGQIVMGAVILGGIGAYYWFKVGRHGGTHGYMRAKLGLRNGEEASAMWMAYYDIDRTTGEKIGELFGAGVRGKNVMVALTNQNRLTIGDNEGSNPPVGFDRGQVSIELHEQSAEIGMLAGPAGLEKAVVMRLTPGDGDAFRLQIAGSGFGALKNWSG